MKLPATSSPWQPLTFGGVAAFAGGTVTRLIKVQFVAALVAALSLLWFLVRAWLPAVEQAFQGLPDEAVIQGGVLRWGGPATQVLADSPFLALAINARESADGGTVADVEVLLAPSEVRVSSLFGHWSLGYPRGWRISLARLDVEAWWQAWAWVVWGTVAVGGVLGVLLGWWIVALLYAVPVRLLAWYCDRALGWSASWKLAGAALVPPVLVVAPALLLYGLHRLNLVGFLFAAALHLAVGWLYLAVAPFRCPRLGAGAGAGRNPFGSGRSRGRLGRRRNPFKR